MIITIDGSAGSGKSTVASKIAKKLGLVHLNSGALFRAIALKARAVGVAVDDDDAVTRLAAKTELAFQLVTSGSSVETRLFVDGVECDSRIVGEEAGHLASRIAVLPKLREVLVEVQRRAAEGCSVVLEGRDAGTIVFPQAQYKFYLDADLDVRARRRFEQLGQLGQTGREDWCLLEEVRRDIESRDTRDSTREIAPQVPASDAIKVDTSHLSIDEVVERVCQFVGTDTREKMGV